MLIDLLEFIFATPVRFVGTCVLIVLVGYFASSWSPVSIRHYHGEE